MKTLLNPKIGIYYCKISYPWGTDSKEYKKISTNSDIIVSVIKKYCYIGYKNIAVKKNNHEILVSGVFGLGEPTEEYWRLIGDVWRYQSVIAVDSIYQHIPVYF